MNRVLKYHHTNWVIICSSTDKLKRSTCIYLFLKKLQIYLNNHNLNPCFPRFIDFTVFIEMSDKIKKWVTNQETGDEKKRVFVTQPPVKKELEFYETHTHIYLLTWISINLTTLLRLYVILYMNGVRDWFTPHSSSSSWISTRVRVSSFQTPTKSPVSELNA